MSDKKGNGCKRSRKKKDMIWMISLPILLCSTQSNKLYHESPHWHSCICSLGQKKAKRKILTQIGRKLQSTKRKIIMQVYKELGPNICCQSFHMHFHTLFELYEMIKKELFDILKYKSKIQERLK